RRGRKNHHGCTSQTFRSRRTLPRWRGGASGRTSQEDPGVMTSDPIWQPLVEELARRQRAGRKAEFWLRDDDAVDPTPALDRLLGLTGEFAVPLTLAVIPALTDEQLVARLDEAPHVTVAVHGWAHRNHAPEDQKKQELGPHRPREAVLDDLARGLSHVTGLHGARAVSMLVPPWNRIDAGLVSALGSIGF